MSAYHHHLLELHSAPGLRIDGRALRPDVLATMSAEAVRGIELAAGSERIAVGDLFAVRAAPGGDGPRLSLEGDLSRFDDLGLGLAEGLLEIRGDAGDGVGLGMTGGRVLVHGRAGELAGCSLRGGWLEVRGSVGDFAASALPGDMDGMRGGTFVIHGNAGARLADRMRRGTLVVHGDVGDFAASRMVAGTLAIGGRAGAHCGYGMRRGTLLFAGPAPDVPPTFVETRHDYSVFKALLARSLRPFGGPFAERAARVDRRLVGDLGADGKGEWLIAE